MQAVAEVVLRKLVFLALNGQPALVDAVGVASYREPKSLGEFTVSAYWARLS